MSKRMPYPSTSNDFEYLARNRRMRWFCLFRAARDLIHATNERDRLAAENALSDAHDRLRSLGVRYTDEAVRVETPEAEQDLADAKNGETVFGA